VGRLGAFVSALLLVSAPRAASADPSSEKYSDYERETVALALERHGGQVEPHAKGKRIVGIDIDVLDVVEERDPAPNFLNIFHANSKNYVIERELLFRVGDSYDAKSVGESERNLRALRQESLVIIVPIRTEDPETVRVLVVAKDIWSLRLNTDYRFRGGDLELLSLQPAEENLAGTHRRILGNFVYEPDTITAGGRFTDPRLAGSRLRWTADGNAIVNHDSGEVEGGFGSLQYGLPLYSTRQEWGWGAFVGFHREVTRRFIGVDLRTYDAVSTPEDDAIPFAHDTEIISGQATVTRSFGYEHKHDFTFGVGAERTVYRAEGLEEFDPVAVNEFREQVLPRSETRNGPFVLYHFYLNDFASLLDVETMALQESYVLGPELYLRFNPIAQVLGSTRDVLGYHGAAAYTHQLGTGFMRSYLGGSVETELLDAGGMRVADSSVQGGVRMVTPPFFIGRLIYDGTVLFRLDNYANSLVRLGGDGRLRGYPTGLFIGENFVASNLEFRSRPLSLWTVRLQGALFYDAADAFDGSDLRIKQGAGFGLRLLFPQLERSVMRVDWGFALTPDPGVTSPFDGLVLTFGQAFGVPRPTGESVSLASQ